MTSLTQCVEQGVLDFSGAPRPPPLEQALLGGHVEVDEVSARNFKGYDPVVPRSSQEVSVESS